MFVNTDLKYIWKNGTYEKWDESSVHILSHTVHYGTGVFEGVRAYKTDKGPAIFRLNDHTERLFSAADKIGINIRFEKNQNNGLTIDRPNYLRLCKIADQILVEATEKSRDNAGE